MPSIAKHIEVTRESSYTLKVDGEEFPWLVGQSVGCDLERDGMPSITVELFADRVDVLDRPWPCIDGTGPCGHSSTARKPDPTGRLARAEAARDQAESALASAQKALEDNQAAIEGLRSDLIQTKQALKASQSTVCGLAEDLAEAQHLARAAVASAPAQDSMLDAAKLSLREAERFEASAEEVERSPSNDCSPGSLDAERVEHLRKLGRDELLLANAQASIAVAEALAADKRDALEPDGFLIPDYGEAEDDQEDDAPETGREIGSAYVSIYPKFIGFDGEEFKQAVRNVVFGL